MESASSPNLVRFESFELDLRARELRKNGVSTGLPDQSVKILAMLLERPGEVVLRAEIQKKLWPNDTIVEFDIPTQATAGGELTLNWRRTPGLGGNGRGCQVAEVWLIRK